MDFARKLQLLAIFGKYANDAKSNSFTVTLMEEQALRVAKEISDFLDANPEKRKEYDREYKKQSKKS